MSENKDLTRRDVVKMAGAAGAVAATAAHWQGAPGIQTVKAANEQIQFGIIGTGSRGQYLLKHLKGIDTGRCVAVCDVDSDAADKAAGVIGTNPTKYKDYRELLSNKNIDAVIIAVPLFLHFPITKDALQAGKHTFCEKSLVFKPEEVHALRKLAAEHPKQVLQVGLQRRYSQYYQIVKDMVDKGVLGEVTHIHAQWHRNPGWVMKPADTPEQTKMKNWRLFREYSGGLTAELASHQIDISDWMFGSSPEFVMGLGDLTWQKDGRDIFDNIQLIYKYPKGQKLVYSSITTNAHLPLFSASRTEFGEVIMGTQGSVEITVGDDRDGVIAIWFREPAKPSVTKAGEKKENVKAGATMVAGAAAKGVPIVAQFDRVDKEKDSFIDREMKFARQWLYSKGILMPTEDRNPVDTELDSFFKDCKTGGKPKADLEVGLADSTAVMLSNIAMDENRKVYFNEIEKMGLSGAAKTS